MTAPDAPTAMTLEEAMRFLAERHMVLMPQGPRMWVVLYKYESESAWLATAETWPVAMSAALKMTVVERDPTAELVKALAFAASVIKGGEPWTDTCEQVIGGALAKWKERQS